MAPANPPSQTVFANDLTGLTRRPSLLAVKGSSPGWGAIFYAESVHFIMEQITKWMKTHSLKVVVAISLCSSLFWIVGIILDVRYGFDQFEFLLGVLILLTLISGIAVHLHWPGFLKLPEAESLSRLIWCLISRTVVSYLLLVPLFALSAYLFVPDKNAHDAPIAVALIALWLPLWLAPGVGAIWVYSRQSVTKNKLMT